MAKTCGNPVLQGAPRCHIRTTNLVLYYGDITKGVNLLKFKVHIERKVDVMKENRKVRRKWEKEGDIKKTQRRSILRLVNGTILTAVITLHAVIMNTEWLRS